ncbi:MAG: ABC transporter ATP-binding protein [Alphaproteobacteria bacterium]|nr:ABC transporter ATP-binding protein [Alphaproteobacteria bacterium]
MSKNSQTKNILEISGLKTCFRSKSGISTAVDGVELNIKEGECLGIVGESGSGKSVTFMSIMGLVRKPGWIAGGSIKFLGKELDPTDQKAMNKIRGNQIAMTMQDALTALNPAYTVGSQIIEVLLAHDPRFSKGGRLAHKEARNEAIKVMDLLRIPNAEARLDSYPHEFSGGMRQRIMIAIALACRPKLLVADEPTTALDVTIQKQVLAVISDLRKELGMSVALITHDMGVVAENCDRVAVMYAGQIVETGSMEQIIHSPKHPYTKGLLASIPDLDHPENKIQSIEGYPPQLVDFPDICRFSERCKFASDICKQIIPMAYDTGQRGYRCLKAEEL